MEKIFKQYYAALCMFANRIVMDETLAEDIVQEVFIRFKEEKEYKNIEEYHRAWLYTAVRNASVNALRTKKKTVENNISYGYYLRAGEDCAVPDCEHALIRTETARQLWGGVGKLPPQMQQVIQMHFSENKSIRDIAKVLNLHVSTVKTQKQRGLALLRKYITFIVSILLFYFSKTIF